MCSDCALATTLPWQSWQPATSCHQNLNVVDKLESVKDLSFRYSNDDDDDGNCNDDDDSGDDDDGFNLSKVFLKLLS